MKEVKIKVKADTTEATKNIENLADSTKDLSKEVDKVSEGVGGVGEKAGKSKKGFSAMGVGIRSVGTALKAAGIGLILAIISGLAEAFSRNKEVMDKLNIALGTTQEVFSQIATALVNTFNATNQTTGGFDAMGRVISALLKVTIYPLEATFNRLLQVSQGLKVAYEQLFGNDASVKKAQDEMDKTTLKLIMLDLKIRKAGDTLVNDFGEAVSEVNAVTNSLVENLSKVDIKAAQATATAYQQATDAAILAQAEAGKLIAFYDRQAEKQRQIRDNANASISERQAANIKLGEILEEQEKQLLKQADAVLAGARAEVAKNDNINNRAALISAEAGKAQVLADIEGKRSEQIANTNALLLEQKGLTTSVTDAERDRAKAQRDFEAEQELDLMKKVEAQREALKLENEAILADLEAKRALYKEGTQQRIDAEQDYLNKKQVLTQAVVTLDKAEADAKVATLQAVSGGVAALGKLAGESAAMQKATGVSTAIIDTYIGANKAFAQGGTAGFVTGGAIIASGLANVATILKTKLPNESGSSQSIPQGGTAQAPSFNLVEGTDDSSAIQRSIEGQGNAPIKAYVTSGDVTSAQAADRAAEANSGF